MTALTTATTRLLTILIVLVSLVATTIATISLVTHFTHVDDLAVTNDLQTPMSFDRYRQDFLYNNQTANFHSARYDIFRTLDSYRVFDLAESSLDHTQLRFIKIFVRTTYAPAQFFLTQFLINEHHPYRTNLILSRLPSLLMYLASALLLALFTHRITRSLAASLLALAITALSWHHLINASLAYNYAAGVLCVILLLILIDNQTPRPLTTALILLALVLLNYQTLLFIPAYFLAAWITDKSPRGRKTIAAAALFLVLILPLFTLKISGIETIHWNAGTHGEYVYTPGSNPITFLTIAGSTTFTNLISPVRASHPYSTVISALLFLTLLLGIISLVKNRRESYAQFILASGLTWLALILSGTIALSPTRHTLILLPFAALLCSLGITTLSHWRSGLATSNITSITLVTLLLAASVLGAPQELTSRHDPFNGGIATLLENSSIVYEEGSTLNLHLMPTFTKHFTFTPSCSCWQHHSRNDNTTISFVSNQILPQRGALDRMNNPDVEEYSLIHNITTTTGASFEFNPTTTVGTNDLQVLIYQRSQNATS